MGRGSSGWAALTQTRHLIWLHRRTIPCPRVLSRQNQCRRDMGVESLGKGCDDIPSRRKAGRGRASERWEAAPNKPQADMVCYHPGTQRAETAGSVGFGATAWWEIQESRGKRQA
jgi:hypothetical protein